MYKAICQQCNKAFDSQTESRKYCSRSCYMESLKLEDSEMKELAKLRNDIKVLQYQNSDWSERYSALEKQSREIEGFIVCSGCGSKLPFKELALRKISHCPNCPKVPSQES